ncbi:uncharacterized protein Pkcdelta isoform X1 [Euwallacea fornicatus]|uniref:uncharacterized protein Pkcdelta isoform X1 n=1 Tax=Euwallacea fornicatus TaxID=995702 RepID=UPI00338F6350
MPYYSELGVYTPSSSYSSSLLKGPYSTHSSILASNFLPPSSKQFGRGNFRGYKPHLTTISESNITPLRRVNSPKVLYHTSPKVRIPRPVKINTADIDVSSNRFKHDPHSVKSEEKVVEKVVEKEAKPNTEIRRDRATIRLQTIHQDRLEKEIGQIKSWRDNFKPDELVTEAKHRRKSPGEVLKDKFLIRSKSKDNLPSFPSPKIQRKSSVKKSPSFKDICKEITSDEQVEDLNPGQPLEVRRRQSRQISHEDVMKEIKRSSSTLSVEEVQLLDALLQAENEVGLLDVPPVIKEEPKSVRKKKVAKKKSEQDVIKHSTSEKSVLDCPASFSRLRKESSLKDMIKDISQVEIEMIPTKQKPIITGYVGTIEERVKSNLKAVVEDLEMDESPKAEKKEKKFRFNVTVQEFPVKKIITVPKFKIRENDFGTSQIPLTQKPVITSILKKRQPKCIVELSGDGLVLLPKPEINNDNNNVDELESVHSNFRVTVNHSDEDVRYVGSPEGSGKLKIVSIEHAGLKTDNDDIPVVEKEAAETEQLLRSTKKNLRAGTFLCKSDLGGLRETSPKAEFGEPTEPELSEELTNDFFNQEEQYEAPQLGALNLELKDPRTLLLEIQKANSIIDHESGEPETPEEYERRIMSKRSLIQKANKTDPDLYIFEPPTPPPPEPEKEPSPEPSFVPLQSNRLSQWMNPWKKPQQQEDCPVEIYAKPKFIRARHIPRRWRKNVSESEASTTTSESEEDESEDEEESESEEEEEQEVDEQNKAGASMSSDDSGFDSGRVKAKGSVDSRDSPGNTLNPATNPAFALDFNDLPEEVCQSSTYQSFQKSGRITPPATTIPRFRKYCVDDFNFLKVLGKGSFGKVLLAELKGTEYYYAIKCLKKDVVLEDDDVECTLIERKVLALGTKHPYLCHLLCTFQTESHLFFVMEYLNGGDLMFHIQAERRFSEARARFYGAEIVSGLKFLHNKGIVYRDLKLDNILLDFDGHVRIADFGMCKLQIFLDRMADTFCGTPDYMAPEIIKGQHYNQCVDWWSFGVLLYEMLLGQSPFSGGDEDELFWSICNEKPVIPRFLSAEAGSVLLQFLEKDANKRLGNRFSPHGDIQDHPFFKPIDWAALEARQLESPFKPNLQHPLDTQYFDKTFTTEKAKLTPIETGILQSMDQTQFQGFSYTNPNATDK